MLAPERWARIRTLLTQVAALPPADRDAYLDRTCAGEPDLRAEVVSLLHAHDAAEGFLDTLGGEPPMTAGLPPIDSVVAPGTRLGVFEIVAPLGAGGMGRVYRARDTRLGRTVAIKVLAPDLADNVDSQARFEREARILSQLNHPHICVLHEAGQATLDGHGDVRYLVMELVDGETLAARLARGPLPLDRALEYATQIAEALDAAHRHGIVHRDLKPANVLLTKTAGVKLLDVGLARLRPPIEHPEATVVHEMLTQRGIVAGTLPYMAPEQVRGEDADARSDLFAFGSVLYEMLTGHRPFDAETPTALMAQILERDPPALAERASHVPVALDRLIRTCLAKDPADRWQHAHDVVLALREIRERDREAPARASSPRTSRWLWAALGAAAVALVVAIAAWDGRPATSRADLPRVVADITLPAGFVPGRFNGRPRQPVISPDGRRLAIVGRWGGQRQQVWIRPMDATSTLTPVPGTEDAEIVFWAPDNERIAFASQGYLRTVALSGGPVQTLCDGIAAFWSGTWGSQGVILVGQEGRLFRIPEHGGTMEPLVLEGAFADGGHSQPSFLPDGRRFLFVVWDDDGPDIALGALDGGDVVPIPQTAGTLAPQYAAGHVLFLRRSELVALPFDVRTARATGPPRTLTTLNAGFYTASDSGTVVALPRQPRDLGFRMPDGAPAATLGSGDIYGQVALSLDGARAAVVKDDGLWVVNLATSAWTRLDARVGGGSAPVGMTDPAWDPDGRRLVYTIWPGGRAFIRDLATGADQLIADLPMFYVIDDWTRDGSLVVFRSYAGERLEWVRAVAPGAPETQRVLWRPAVPVDQIQVSPDGRCVAYNALDSGAWEVYVARFPSFTDAQQVSASRGGVQPIWAHDGQRLFYLAYDGTMMGADLLRDGERLTADAPHALFSTRLTNPSPWLSEYDVTKDGRFLLIERAPGPHTLRMLMNWAAPGT